MLDKPDLWKKCNEILVAKIIGECSYEECLSPKNLGHGRYSLSLASGVRYDFEASISIWGWLIVNPSSISLSYQDSSTTSEVNSDHLSAAQFCIHAQSELKLSDIILANLIEEIQNTLFSDTQRQQRIEGFSAADMIALQSWHLQSLIEGHPKAIANKGRMGWGVPELAQYAPESGKTFGLEVILVQSNLCSSGFIEGYHPWDIVIPLCDGTTQERLNALINTRKINKNKWLPMPVHPWQWQHFIQIQYQQLIAEQKIIYLGRLQDEYAPQQSIRTLTNANDSAQLDTKLPLTILNTSCYRGIPGGHIATGAKLSTWLSNVIASDSTLNTAGLTVQKEVCGIHCNHPLQAGIDAAPYRYKEMLAVVWRESLEQFLAPNQSGILMSTLFQTDANGRALIVEFIDQSDLTSKEWLSQLFDVVVIPLYHLMAKYGIGLVAHGQNISLVLENNAPLYATIKDFHGDLRRVNLDFPELNSLPVDVNECLTKLPPEYLIHDLVTGHFVTTLRFISPLIEQQCNVSEIEFYQLLALRLTHYQEQHPNLVPRFELFPMFESDILKVCINRVRFRIGYEDHAERPVPELGTPIRNPLTLTDQSDLIPLCTHGEKI